MKLILCHNYVLFENQILFIYIRLLKLLDYIYYTSVNILEMYVILLCKLTMHLILK